MCPHLRSMILKTHLEARKRGLREVLHQLQQITQGTLHPARAIGDVAVFQKEAQYAVVSKSSDNFKQWCRSSLAKGAAGAHAFLRKADEPPQIHVTFNDKRRDGSDPCTALSLRSDTWRRHWTKHENCRRTDQLATAFKQARRKRSISRTSTGTPPSRPGRSLSALRRHEVKTCLRARPLDPWQLVEPSDRGEKRYRFYLK